MKPIERAKVSLHEKSSIDDDFAPVETDSTIKVPGAAFNRSPIEVRVFGLPHNRSDAARAKLKRIFDNINKRGKKFDNGDEGYIEIGHFDIHEGEPDLQTSNTNKFQSTAKINFSPLGKLHVTKKLEAMDAVRMALIELKAEGFRSCGKDLDRRAQGDRLLETSRSGAGRSQGDQSQRVGEKNVSGYGPSGTSRLGTLRLHEGELVRSRTTR